MAKLRSEGENGSSLRIAVPSSSFANGECQVTECGGSIDALCKFLAHRKPTIEMVSATFIIAHDFFFITPSASLFDRIPHIANPRVRSELLLRSCVLDLC